MILCLCVCLTDTGLIIGLNAQVKSVTDMQIEMEWTQLAKRSGVDWHTEQDLQCGGREKWMDGREEAIHSCKKWNS